ncbi:MAG: glycosyltransferase [Crocinitomix sp.]|nr:glycosyltransferase [Crocinitomix sp.]
MKILKIIHGYPPLFNAGSEVYSQSICNELSKNNQVLVFTREENPFRPDFTSRKVKMNENLEIVLINNPNGKDGYRHAAIDDELEGIICEFRPDIAHIGHLNHLSTGIVDVLFKKNIPIIYTLHDFWLMCPRGQFLTRSIGKKDNLAVCEKQEKNKCAKDCYEVYHSGNAVHGDKDLESWSGWIDRRMEETKAIIEKVDQFIAPSKYLMNRFIQEFNVPEHKIMYMDYGFPLQYLQPSKQKPKHSFTFGYIGTHIPAKGVNLLIEAFKTIDLPTKLIIFGREKEPFTSGLKEIAQNSIHEIEFRPEYKNEEIVTKVFDEVDAIVVPSIWGENSPLVIHEAQACHIPVITANFGGMKEYVSHLENGLLFKHRKIDSIREQMEWAIKNPDKMKALGKRGYLANADGTVMDLKVHCEDLTRLYQIHMKKFWRLTLDTNPEDCNLSCTMCEEHSPFSDYIKNKLGGKRRRMPESWLEDIFIQASNLGVKEIIPSTMGEPLLYKHFDQIVALCRKYNILMNLTTNGTFPKVSGKTVEEWAKQILPVTSDIKFSWNGATSETSKKVMIGIDFENTISNVKTFVHYRNQIYTETGHYCNLTFQLTFMEENMPELAEIVKLAANLDIDRVKGHHLWTHFDEIEDQNLKRSSESIARWNNYADQAIESALVNLRKNGHAVVLENIKKLEVSETNNVDIDKECPFLGKELWISATGKFSPCCAPDEQRQLLGDFGHFPDQSISKTLQSKRYLDLQHNYKTKELCKKCLMRK